MPNPPSPTSGPYSVFCGLDVGKAAHHACALSIDGRRLFADGLPNDEQAVAVG